MESELFIYTKHYGDRNKCPMCQSMEMKAEFSENKIGLYKRHICKDKDRDSINEEKVLSNVSITKNNFLPPIKNIDDKYNNILQYKGELSPLNIYSNKDNFSLNNLRNQFTFNILKNRFKRSHHKFGIIDFPVLNNYFNS